MDNVDVYVVAYVFNSIQVNRLLQYAYIKQNLRYTDCEKRNVTTFTG